MDFHWRMICFSLSFSLTFPLNQTISIVSQISYKLSDLIYIHISIINYHSYVVSSRIDLVVYCYWILWLLRNKTSIVATVITHNQQKKNVYTVEVLLCFENKCFFSKIPILKSYWMFALQLKTTLINSLNTSSSLFGFKQLLESPLILPEVKSTWHSKV